MATFNFDEVDKYVESQGEGVKFFKLEDHNWSAKVRFLYGPGEIFQGHTVHNISTDGKKPKFVMCLRDEGDPLDKCPLCKAGNLISVQFYIPLYVISITECINGVMQPEKPVNEIRIFQRGRKFAATLSSIARQCQGTPIVNNIFNIVRNGRAQDVQTVYMAEFAGRDSVGLEQLPQRPQIAGSYILPQYDYNKMSELVSNNTNTSAEITPRTISTQYTPGVNNFGVPF